VSDLFERADSVEMPGGYNPLFERADALEEEEEKLRQALQHGVKQNPDTAAKDQANARKLDVSIDVVERNSVEVDQISREKEALNILKDSEGARKFLSDPDRAAAHSDNISALVYLENTLKSITNQIGIKEPADFAAYVGANLVQATAGLAEGALRFPGDSARLRSGVEKGLGIPTLPGVFGTSPIQIGMEALGKGIGGAPGLTSTADQLAANMDAFAAANPEVFGRIEEKHRKADEATDAALMGDFGPLADVLTDPEAVAGFIAQAAPSVVAAWLSGGSMPFMMFMEGMEVSSDAAEFEERTGQKISDEDFAQAYAQASIIGGLFEKIGFTSMFGKRIAQSATGGFFTGMLGEMTTEGLQALNSNLAIHYAYNENKSLTGGILPGIIGGAGVGGPTGSLSAMGRASDAKRSEHGLNLSRAEKAFRSSAAMDESVAAMAELNIEGRDKEEIRKFIEDQVGAENSVYMAPEDAQAFFQSHPEVLEALPEESAAAITESLSMGADVAIPVADYLTYFSDFHAEVSDILRNDMDGMTTAEASRWSETAEESVMADAIKILDDADRVEEFTASADRVRDNLKQQLIASGRRTPAQAEMEANMHRIFAMTVALRPGWKGVDPDIGITPEQVYEKFGLKVQGTAPEQSPQDVFNQQARDLGLNVAGRTPSGEILVGQTSQAHFQLFDEFPQLFGAEPVPGGKESEMGFADAEGNFFTREEAMDYIEQQATLSPTEVGAEGAPNQGRAARGLEDRGMLASESEFYQSERERFSMDLEARKARAEEMGLTESVFHASDQTYDQFENRDIGFHFAANPALAENAATLTGKHGAVAKEYRINPSNFVEVKGSEAGFTNERFLDSLADQGVITQEEANDLIESIENMEIEMLDEYASDQEIANAQGEHLSKFFQSKGIEGFKYWNEYDAYGDAMRFIEMEGMRENLESEGVQPDWSYIVFDPANIRSVHATFDPAQQDSADLLAQSAVDQHWESWTPELTKGGVIKGGPEWVNNPADLAKMEQTLHQLVQEGMAGRYWYEESARRILALTRGDFVEAERLIQVIAIYSPQTSVQVNTGFAVRAWTQWKEGWPINVKTGDQDAKAQDVFNGKDYAGRKTNSFYQNLMYEIVNQYPESMAALKLDQDLINTFHKPATIDVWMLRAFGYQNDSASNDKGAGKYSFSENYLRKVTAQLNKENESDPWTPHQVQAAIWTAMKARYELHDVKQATNEESVAKGYSVKVGKNKFERKPGVENKRNHLAIWRKHAMAVSSARAIRAATEQAASFETFIDQMTRVITWEAKPSEKLGLDIFGASDEVIRQFTREAASLILTEEGEDTLATLLGVPLNHVSFSEGAYDGAVTPNALSHLLPPKDPGAFGVKEAQTYARAIQYIFKQDAVPWFRPEPLALSKAAQDKQKFRVINVKTGHTVPKSKQAPDGGIFDSLADAQKLAAKRGDGFGVRGGEYAHGVTLMFDHALTAADERAVLYLLGEGGGFTKIASDEIAIVNFRDDETHVPFVDDDVFALKTPSGKPFLIRKALPTDRIYKSGYSIGVKNSTPSSKPTQEKTSSDEKQK